MNKEIRTEILFEDIPDIMKPLFDGKEYPWEVLSGIKEYAEKLISEGIDGYTLLSGGVLIGQNVKIYPTATIEGPAIIGEGTEIRPGAFIRGSVITGKDCVIGNSTEIKNAVLMDRAQVPHYNYVGDSVLGNHAHMGAGAVCSNLKGDGKPVVIRGEARIETGLRKIGGIMGDNADVGCGCVLNPGTVVGKNTRVYPLTSLRGVYPCDVIVKSQGNYVVKEDVPK